MKKPKEKLKEIYNEYLKTNSEYNFQFWLKLEREVTTTIHQLTQECGFSTTAECRKAISELEKQLINCTAEKYNSGFCQFPICSCKPKEETWHDIIKEYPEFGKKSIEILDFWEWLKENFKTPERL